MINLINLAGVVAICACFGLAAMNSESGYYFAGMFFGTWLLWDMAYKGLTGRFFWIELIRTRNDKPGPSPGGGTCAGCGRPLGDERLNRLPAGQSPTDDAEEKRRLT